MIYPTGSTSFSLRSAKTANTEKPNLAQKQRHGYWNDYYASAARKKPIPSQFAVFVANEWPGFDWLLDIGCGNGRDSIFFSESGYNVLGVDGSEAAVTACQIQKERLPDESGALRFLCEKIDALEKNNDFCDQASSLNKIIYSRFFLHAINETEEDAFIHLCELIAKTGDVLALEFRTTDDEHRAKVTPEHYRRYVNVNLLLSKFKVSGQWKLIYRTEGTGLAKYKDDDAHVCRLLLTATGKVPQ